MKKILIIALSFITLASCSVEQPTPQPNPYYLDGTYVVNFTAYEYYGGQGSDTMVFDSLCVVEFDSLTMTTYTIGGVESVIPELGARFESTSSFSVKYTDGGVYIATQWDLVNGYYGELWETFGNKGMVRTEDWSPYGYSVFLQHIINLEKID